MSLNTELAREFATLTAKKADLSSQIDAIKEELRGLEEPLKQNMALEGVDSLPIQLEDGETYTLYLHRQIWAKPKDGDKVAGASALKLGGLGHFVSEGFNTSTLSAWLREALSNGEEIPKPVVEAFDLNEVVSVRGRRASRAAKSTASINLQKLNSSTN